MSLLKNISSFHLFICCLILVICSENNANSDVCFDTIRLPNVLYLRNKTYFFNVYNSVNWMNANLACKEYNMELVAIDTDEEFDLLVAYISKMELVKKFWTSGTNLGREDEYKWLSNGRKIFLKRWHQGQPDNAASSEHCLQILEFKNATLLNDYRCDMKMWFICQSLIKTYCAKETYSEC